MSTQRTPWVGAMVVALILVVSAWLGVAHAVDGVVLITQNLVTASGGFPFTITQAGSYGLGGNLTVPANIDGIVIAADNVTLDLNGFAILGSGGGSGVSDAGVVHSGITVRNGTVRNFATGIEFFHSGLTNVEQIRALQNSGN